MAICKISRSSGKVASYAAGAASLRAASVPSRMASSRERGDRQSPASSTAMPAVRRPAAISSFGTRPSDGAKDVGVDLSLEIGHEDVAEADRSR